jgi:hypothetical protein
VTVVILVGWSYFARSKETQIVCLAGQACLDQSQEVIIIGQSKISLDYDLWNM